MFHNFSASMLVFQKVCGLHVRYCTLIMMYNQMFWFVQYVQQQNQDCSLCLDSLRISYS